MIKRLTRHKELKEWFNLSPCGRLDDLIRELQAKEAAAKLAHTGIYGEDWWIEIVNDGGFDDHVYNFYLVERETPEEAKERIEKENEEEIAYLKQKIADAEVAKDRLKKLQKRS